jgi:Rod binding domain-containing protein
MSGVSLVSNPLPDFSQSPVISALPPLTAPQFAQGAKAARDFEAQLIANVLESMEKTFAALPGQGSLAGEDDYNYLGTQALASAMAEGGGFGIAKLISEHLMSRPPSFPATDTEVMPEGPSVKSEIACAWPKVFPNLCR